MAFLSCYGASLSCALALAAAELAAAAGAPPTALSAVRLLLLCVWARCWMRAGPGKRAGGEMDCGAADPTTGGQKLVQKLLVQDVNATSGTAAASRRTWRSAGVRLPEPEVAMNLMKSRRSVFCKDMAPDRQLEAGTLRLLLEAASWAPSHGRTDPWHFVVFQSPQGLAALAQLSVALLGRQHGAAAAAAAQEEFAPGKRWDRASALIAICARRRPRCCTPGGEPRYNPEWEEVAAVACAVQNMHLMATALPGGVCGYWSSWYECVRDSPEMHELLGLADGDRCLGFFVVGRCDHVGEIRASRSPSSPEWR